MSAQAVGQGLAALQHAQHVEHDEAEGGLLGQLAGDGKGAVQWHPGGEQRGQFLVKNRTSRRRPVPNEGSLISKDVPLGATPT